MKVMPFHYVSDVGESERFYAALGLDLVRRDRTPGWSEMAGHTGFVGLHAAEGGDPPRAPGTVEIVLVAEEPLEGVAARLEAAGYHHDPIADEAFGRFMTVAGPDGLGVQVQEHDPSLYT